MTKIEHENENLQCILLLNLNVALNFPLIMLRGYEILLTWNNEMVLSGNLYELYNCLGEGGKSRKSKLGSRGTL